MHVVIYGRIQFTDLVFCNFESRGLFIRPINVYLFEGIKMPDCMSVSL
ncbi:MAG: hypothetical protein KatS3mg083_434 [Candidatus Dojkabacteria bacterium]|nr:MAG: hypothetical protein KatS3mg083_434 [Candidatus Dojkabacteria bacterium]